MKKVCRIFKTISNFTSFNLDYMQYLFATKKIHLIYDSKEFKYNVEFIKNDISVTKYKVGDNKNIFLRLFFSAKILDINQLDKLRDYYEES